MQLQAKVYDEAGLTTPTGHDDGEDVELDAELDVETDDDTVSESADS